MHLHEFDISKWDMHYELVSEWRLVDYLSNNKKIDRGEVTLLSTAPPASVIDSFCNVMDGADLHMSRP